MDRHTSKLFLTSTQAGRARVHGQRQCPGPGLGALVLGTNSKHTEERVARRVGIANE